MMGSGRDGLWPVYGSEDHVDALGMGELTGGLAVLSDALGALVGCPGVVWGAVTSPADLVGVSQAWPVSCMVILDTAGHSWWGWSMGPVPVSWPTGDGTGRVYAVLRTEAAVDGPVAYGTRDSYDVVAYPSGSPAPDNALGLADYTVTAGVVTDLVALSTGLVDGDRGRLARRDVAVSLTGGVVLQGSPLSLRVEQAVAFGVADLFGPPDRAPYAVGEVFSDALGGSFLGTGTGDEGDWVQVGDGQQVLLSGWADLADLDLWAQGVRWPWYRLRGTDGQLWVWRSTWSYWAAAAAYITAVVPRAQLPIVAGGGLTSLVAWPAPETLFMPAALSVVVQSVAPADSSNYYTVRFVPSTGVGDRLRFRVQAVGVVSAVAAASVYQVLNVGSGGYGQFIVDKTGSPGNLTNVGASAEVFPVRA